MIGVFDSGVGGFTSLARLSEIMPREDYVYLADRRHAPYGKKSKNEIISYTRSNIELLRSLGAEMILIACCTASTVHSELEDGLREISLPIIAPAALAAADGKIIEVIATRHTALCRAFSKAIAPISGARVLEYGEQRLVALVEGGCRDGSLSRECERELDGICRRATDDRADTLILGCTHFSHLGGEIKRRLPGVRIISPAEEGANALSRLWRGDGGHGKLTFINTKRQNEREDIKNG